jgi:hypothetical protein
MSGDQSVGPRRQFGEGPLARIAAFVYALMAVELLLLLTTLPGLVLLVALDRDASDAPLVVACGLPVGPALSAAVYALRHHRGDLADLRPAAAFWRGYRLNAGGVLRLWIPWLAGLALIAENLAHVRAAGVPHWWSALLVVVAVVSSLWMANALVITSLFTFRPVDVVRLAMYFLGRTRGVTLANLCLLVVAVGVVLVASEAGLALAAVLFTAGLLRAAQPLVVQVTEDFTA